MHCDIHNLDYEQQKRDMFGKVMTFGSCPECDREIEAENAAREKQALKDFEIATWRRCNIEPLYFAATFDNFIAETPELEKAKAAALLLVSSKTGKLLMLGKNGTGKTHLAVCAVKALGGAIYTMYEISVRIRATYTPIAKEGEQEVVDELSRIPLLVIDEIGRTKGSEAEENWLSYIIDKRNSRSLPLILISNKHTKKTCPAGGCKDCIENYISEDVMSRLCVGGKMLNFTGEDWRKKR